MRPMARRSRPRCAARASASSSPRRARSSTSAACSTRRSRRSRASAGIARGLDLPPLLLQGGAVRPDGHRLPRRARRRPARRVAAPRARRPRSPSAPAPTPVLRALPRLPGLRAVAHAPAGAASCTPSSLTRSGCAWGRDGDCLGGCSPSWPTAREPATPRLDDPAFTANLLWTRRLDRCTSRASASPSAWRPGVPELFAVDARAGRRDLVAHALGAVSCGPAPPPRRRPSAS